MLWAVEELTAPLAERLRHHFIGNPNTDRIDHPEWLFETVKRLASRLAPQLTTLTQCLAAHELHASYHLPFEFVRALRAALQARLRLGCRKPSSGACLLHLYVCSTGSVCMLHHSFITSLRRGILIE